MSAAQTGAGSTDDGADGDGQQPCGERLPMPMVTEVPIESVGVVHVTTTPVFHVADLWESKVVLARYTGGSVVDSVFLTEACSSADTAEEMHLYFCDVETLALCVQGDRRGLYPLWDLEYFDRKQLELFGRQS